jgi:hypothetical protein
MMIDQVGKTKRLTIGEGVETTLAARQWRLKPAWALGSVGHNWPLPGDPRRGPPDYPEEAGKPSRIMAFKCARRWRAKALPGAHRHAGR